MSTWGSVKIETNDTWNKCYLWYKVVSWLLAWAWSINFFMLFIKVSINIYVIICISIVCWYLSYKLGCLGGVAGNWVRHFTSPSSVRVRNPSAENIMKIKLHWLFNYQLIGIMLGGGLAFGICSLIIIVLKTIMDKI